MIRGDAVICFVRGNRKLTLWHQNSPIRFGAAGPGRAALAGLRGVYVDEVA